jgi:hypothetical protein
VMSLFEQVLHDVLPYGIFRVMTGELYFRTGALPWGGLLVSAAVSAVLLYGASFNFSQQDF